MILHGKKNYEEEDQDAIRVVDSILLLWKDIGQRCMKYFKQNKKKKLKLVLWSILWTN
jgi:hypothetical protein